MRYEIDVEKFYDFLMREYKQCTALTDSFAEECNWAKAWEYDEDASVYGSLLDAFEEHNAGKHDWLIPKREEAEVVWHDLRKDSQDRPKENGMMAAVIETASGQTQIMWYSRQLPAGTVKWCYVPRGEENGID